MARWRLVAVTGFGDLGDVVQQDLSAPECLDIQFRVVVAAAGDRCDVGQAQDAAGALGPQRADLAVACGSVRVAGGSRKTDAATGKCQKIRSINRCATLDGERRSVSFRFQGGAA